MVFAGIVKESEDVETPEAMTWFVESELGSELSICRSKVLGSEAEYVHETVIGCVGSMVEPGNGERMLRA